jgi:hypothetical protein
VGARAGLLRQLYGDVVRAGGGAGDTPLCEADSVSHSSTAAGGIYAMVVDPACLGRVPDSW